MGVLKEIDSDHEIVFWQSSACPRADALAAFGAEGLEGMIPNVDYFAAIRATAHHIVDTYGVKAKGRCDYNGLAASRDACGIEVRRFIKGEKKNDLPFLFSIGVMENPLDGELSVEILECDPQECPEIQGRFIEVQDSATAYFQSQIKFVTANDLTNAIAGMVKKLHGQMLLERGVVWYLPSETSDPYHRIADALKPHGVKMFGAKFQPTMNEHLLAHVCSTIEDNCRSVFDYQLEEMHKFQTEGRKPRSNGMATRLDAWLDAEANIQFYKKMLGGAFVNLAKAAKAAQEAIGNEAVRMFQ
jgi:hypothetical protein